ncbi:MAG: hypothetical protein LAT67_02940 [Balneolales bacterium]|nr:hypothetical protein [Balneolales bacterium]
MKSHSPNDIWDEHQWESHISQAEQKNEEIRSFLAKTFGDDGPRWVKILQESDSELEALEMIIEEELMFDEAYLPDDDDDWDDEDLWEDFELDSSGNPKDFDLRNYLTEHSKTIRNDDNDDNDDDTEIDTDSIEAELDEDLDSVLPKDSKTNEEEIAEFLDDLLGSEFEDIDDEDPFLEDGEEWKMLSEDYALSDYGALENLPVYMLAHDLGAHLLKRSQSLQLNNEESGKLFQKFVSNILTISTKLAAGYSLGFDEDMLGGNIVYSKRALYAANEALTDLQKIRETDPQLFGHYEYKHLHADVFNLRNTIGIYIQDLRDLFEEL